MIDVLLSAIAPFQGIGLAIALGLLIGVERGWEHRNDPDGSRVAGIRTFALLGLAGGMAGEIGSQVSPSLAAIFLAIAALALLAGYIRSLQKTENLSATTTIVGLITLGIGVFAAIGQEVLAAVIAAVMTLILSSRRQLHAWLSTMSEAEVQAIARFSLISLAILPILPDQAFGPFDAWNPRQLWMVVVLVSGLSFAGYLASKRLGPERGVIVTAAVGAIVSSTAVTVSLASRLRRAEGAEPILIAGIAAASAVMFLRVLVLVAMLAPFALTSLAVIIGPATVFSVVSAIWLLRKPRGKSDATAEAAAVHNPFDMRPALVLLGLVMVLSVVSRWTLVTFGNAGLGTVLALSGMVDVDAAIMTMSGLPAGTIDARTAGLILAAPVMLNSLLKAGLAITIGGGRAGWRAAVPLLISVACGLVALPLLWWHL